MDASHHPLIQKYIASNHFGKHLGMSFEIIEPGIVHYTLPIKQEHLATPFAAHGGVLSALVDAALGVAALSLVCHENKVVSTVEFKLNYLAPALLNDVLLAKARVEHKGKRIVISSCDIVALNRESKLLVKALGTFNAYDTERAGY